MVPVESYLKAALPGDLVEALLDAYREIEENFRLAKWRPSELNAGHFVEAVRRVIELRLFGQATPISGRLSNFSDQVLRSYENATGDESYRILIPRLLKAIYGVRNKRGVGHLSGFSPNRMDATLILHSVKWVLAEVVRIEAKLEIEETQALVEEIVERRLELVWRDGDVVRVMSPSMAAKDQVLVLLYDQSPQLVAELKAAIEYANMGRFREILQKLHRGRLIEYRRAGEMCSISPRGITAAESLVASW